MIDKDKFDKWIDEMPDLIATGHDPHINSKVKYWLRGITDWITPVLKRDKTGTDGVVACANCYLWTRETNDLFCLDCGRTLRGTG